MQGGVDATRPTSGWEHVLVGALALATAALQLPLSKWNVDDAGIAASYARNLANGLGLVPYPGGERVEGYSDPLWVALLAVGERLGLNALDGAKVLGAVLAAACVPLAWRIARRLALPNVSSRVARVVPLVAALLVATNAQHVIWGAAGLENALFSFMLAWGTWRVLVEAEAGGVPWASLVFLGVALTRPEGVVYAAGALFTAAVLDARQGRGRRVWAIVLTFVVPFVAYHVVRYAYFALPFPTTYYVKVVKARHDPLIWDSRSWRYVRNWATGLGWAWTAPVLLVGVVGTRGWRALGWLAWSAALGLALWWPDMEGGADARVALLIAGGALLPFLATGSSRGVTRLLAAGWVVCTVAFAVRAGGDWMRASRFMSPLVVPLAVLYASGLAEIAARVPRWLGPPVLAGLIMTPLHFNLNYLGAYQRRPEEINVEAAHRRVNFYNHLADRLRLRRPWVAVDHTQGGMTWWAPPRGRAIDTVGLTDVAFALRSEGPAFRAQYIESPPTFDFAHVIGGGGVTTDTPFLDQFVRVPGYRNGKRLDHDTWVNRGLMTTPTWPGPPRQILFEGDMQLEGLDVPAPEVRALGTLYVELGLRRGPEGLPDFKVQVFLTGPRTVVMDAPLGYDGLLPVPTWRANEVYIGRYNFRLPADLPAGDYDLGVVLSAPDGTVLRAQRAPDDVVIGGPEHVVAPGEVRFPAKVSVRTRNDVSTLTEADIKRALKRASSGNCEGAEDDWRRAGARRADDAKWLAALDDRVRTPLANCWSRAVPNVPDLDQKLLGLANARRWDPTSAAAYAAGSVVADAVMRLADNAREDGDVALAREFYEAVVTADPRRSWARRYAEEARTEELELPPAQRRR